MFHSSRHGFKQQRFCCTRVPGTLSSVLINQSGCLFTAGVVFLPQSIPASTLGTSCSDEGELGMQH